MEITIILPVYGRSELLGPALESVLQLQDPGWQLLIADDGSDADTQAFIKGWIDSQNHDTRVQWVRRPQNLGLFGNLNRAIEESQSEWVLLLCSDDLLLPHAIERINEMCERWSDAGLILSTYESINEDGSPRPADSAWHHAQVSQETSLVQPERFVPALLRLGSLNGNLSGMAFSRSHWRAAGPFREDWRHAADWEWLLRATERQPVVLNRVPIAQVRTHERQLSNSNRRSGHELQEVASVVQQLREHPLLSDEPRRHRWAAHVMQFQLWNVLKQFRQTRPKELKQSLKDIHQSAGLRQTVWTLVRWLPARWRRLPRTSAP
ncbi:glycosyltransferase family 2 protein [Synechococcus sp. NB0720_010]|uniref:glycosyltransferase family 2 protein n=1 Tax=Synechococcus sp. NB0720_010 TaxID=2907159 RepID=UPI001FF7F9D5|nr:glycosyltransferase family 2 protein [Synechococcus sp. NB0720_010]UPH89159.1 glycosyltransferase family 2 protein [Synechococcus sp. NB0720_010]